MLRCIYIYVPFLLPQLLFEGFAPFWAAQRPSCVRLLRGAFLCCGPFV
jgi:hypothetical protein